MSARKMMRPIRRAIHSLRHRRKKLQCTGRNEESSAGRAHPLRDGGELRAAGFEAGLPRRRAKPSNFCCGIPVIR
jgi:hypothetical protein